MERRVNSLLLVSTFEALERYLKRTFGTFLYQLRNDVVISDKKEFHRKNVGWSKREGTPQYYQRYSDHTCQRNGDRAIGGFAKELDWTRVLKNGPRGMSYISLIEVMGVCRHSIVHAEGRVSAEKLRTLQKEQRAFVDECLFQSGQNQEKTILHPSDMLNQLFETIASYGWALYILISDRCGMKDEVDFFHPDASGPRKVGAK
jgi:hypothetical protein